MSDLDIRWKQRFDNFRNAFAQLSDAVEKGSYTLLERAGLIQTFEFTLELGWKCLKDFLEAEGFLVATPRETIKQAFQSGYISDGHAWLRALEDRNQLSHTYDEALSVAAQTKISTQYYPLLRELFDFFSKRAGS